MLCFHFFAVNLTTLSVTVVNYRINDEPQRICKGAVVSQSRYCLLGRAVGILVYGPFHVIIP
jgi:hypothetical protein